MTLAQRDVRLFVDSFFVVRWLGAVDWFSDAGRFSARFGFWVSATIGSGCQNSNVCWRTSAFNFAAAVF